MKIWVHPYELRSRSPRFSSRAGALVKVEWALHQIGYSDLHPWPEFGEAPLDHHLESLASVDFTRLAEVSMEFNYIDREFRLHKRNAFLGLILPRSHRLVFDLENLEGPTLNAWQAAGFSHLKVKIDAARLNEQTEAFSRLAYATSMLWRLDFGGKLTATEFGAWWENLDDALKARVDFVEDPSADDGVKPQGPWADDWRKQKASRVRVVKPAREAAEELVSYDRVVFTHGLDHPLGQAAAVWSAARFYGQHPRKTEVCGLAAPDVYEPDDFGRAWSCEGPRLKPPPGTGFGFDQLL
jgi:O-succinylbenzoate synthase